MCRAARGRGKPTSLHQGARRRVEVVVARRTGDREGAHRAGWADREGDADNPPRAPRARGVRIEETATDGGAHLPYIGRKRGSARRCARGCACRGSAAGSLSGRRPRLRFSRPGRSRLWLWLRSRLGSRRFDTRRRSWLGPWGRHRLRRLRWGRRRRKLHRSRRRGCLRRRRRRLLLHRRRRLLSHRRRRRLLRRDRGLLDRRRRRFRGR